MLNCLKLAKKGFGKVSPNPMVACIIVHDGQIIGQGYHQNFGEAHAEVNALASVQDKSLLKNSTVYVNLEPCSHFGKTPPCADLLVSFQVKKVVIGVHDPNLKVAGKGIEILQRAGIEVKISVLEKESKLLNKRFFINQNKNRPFVILKWAESADGFMSSVGRKQISGLAAQTRLHKWRTEEDAFMIGTETLLNDNPQLNSRLWKGKNPIRVAIDMQLRSENKSLKFFDQSQTTIVLNAKKDDIDLQTEYIKLISNQPMDILQALYKRNIGSLVIEGGASLLKSFINAGLYDEIRRIKSKNVLLNNGLSAPKIDFQATLIEDLIDDELLIYAP